MQDLKRRLYIVVGLMIAIMKGFAQDGTSNIEFVENKGQWDSRVKFKGEIGVGAVYLENTGFSALLYNVDDLNRITNNHHGIKQGGYTKVGNYVAPPKGGPVGGIDPEDALRSHAYRV